jgi:O-antigen ligase
MRIVRYTCTNLLHMYRLPSKINAEKINYFALLLLAFSINFPQRIVIYSIAFWLLTCLPILRLRTTNRVRNVSIIPLFLLTLLFLGRILIAIYHSDLSIFVTKQLIDTQLPLLLLPFILIFQVNKLIEPGKVLLMYIAGCFVSSVVAVICFYLFRFGVLNPWAHLLFVPLRDVNSTIADDIILFQDYISAFFKHRAAIGANLVMAIACLVYAVKGAGGVKGWRLVAVIFVGLFFVSVIYATGSRSGLVSLFFILLISLTYLLFNERKKRLVIGFFFIAALLSGCMSLKTTRSLLANEVATLDYDKIRTADPRFRIWESAIEIIKENPIVGVGYSEVKPLLIEKNKSRGLKEFAKERLNSHNQFLQFSLESGIWATVLYVIFLLPIYFGNENRYLSISFSTLFFLYSMFEDSLLLINGVSALVFFITMLYLLSNTRKELTES